MLDLDDFVARGLVAPGLVARDLVARDFVAEFAAIDVIFSLAVTFAWKARQNTTSRPEC